MASMVFSDPLSRELLTYNSDKVFLLPAYIWGSPKTTPYGELTGFPNTWRLPVRRCAEPTALSPNPFFSDRLDEKVTITNSLRECYRQTIAQGRDIVLPHDLLDCKFSQLSTHSPAIRAHVEGIFREHFRVALDAAADEMFEFF